MSLPLPHGAIKEATGIGYQQAMLWPDALRASLGSIQFIPFTVIGLLASYGSRNPNAIFRPTFISTVISSITAVGILYVFKACYHKGK